MGAADEICRLISISSPLVSRTPFFACALALQGLVHLGAHGLPEYSHKKPLMLQQIQMSIGALRRLSNVWETAGTVLKRMKGVAREMLDISRDVVSLDHTEAELSAQQPPEAVPSDDMLLLGFDSMVSRNDDDAWFDEFLGQRVAG